MHSSARIRNFEIVDLLRSPGNTTIRELQSRFFRRRLGSFKIRDQDRISLHLSARHECFAGPRSCQKSDHHFRIRQNRLRIAAAQRLPPDLVRGNLRSDEFKCAVISGPKNIRRPAADAENLERSRVIGFQDDDPMKLAAVVRSLLIGQILKCQKSSVG